MPMCICIGITSSIVSVVSAVEIDLPSERGSIGRREYTMWCTCRQCKLRLSRKKMS